MNKSVHGSIIQKPQVDYSEVKIYSKVKEEFTFESKGKSIFQAGDTKNCKDFLNTYFQSKEPKSFDNFKKKYQMQNARVAMAKKERVKILNGGQMKYKKSFFRPPDTPLLGMYATGMYTKEVKLNRFKKSQASPDVASSINDRNKKAYDEFDVKTITAKRHSQRYYDPTKYLKPMEEQTSKTIDTFTSVIEPRKSTEDLSMNSLAFNRVLNKKKAIQEGRNQSPGPGVKFGQAISNRSSFVDIKSKLGQDRIESQRLATNGKQIFEKVLQASKDEHEYFNNHKIFTKEANEGVKYKRQIPEHLRIMENPYNQKELRDFEIDGMITIVSKNQGWITVTPRSLNRKYPVERGCSLSGEATKTSILTPSWMQIRTENAPKADPLKGVIQQIGLRAEENRTFLGEKQQPQKGVFTIGAFRHNVTFREQVDQNQAKVLEPTRFIEWKGDNPSAQKYDKKISPKIGSFHEREYQTLHVV